MEMLTLHNADYEQQRLLLLHKHGIDLEDGSGFGDGTKTKRLDRAEVERLMGGEEGQGGIFTWREKHRRKVSFLLFAPSFLIDCYAARLFCVSP